MLQQIFSEPFGKLSGIMTERNSLSVKEIPVLFLLSLIVGRFNIFPVPEAYVLRVTFDFPLNFNASMQSCLFFLTVSPEPHFRVVEQQILVVPLTMMSWLFQLFLRTYLMPPLDLSLPILIIQNNLQILLRHLHWLVLIFATKLKLCPLSAVLCMIYPLPPSIHLSVQFFSQKLRAAGNCCTAVFPSCGSVLPIFACR